MQDNRPFPTDVRVAAKNDNKADPDTGFSGHFVIRYNGENYSFPPGKAVLLMPETAYWMFLYDTRSETKVIDGKVYETGQKREYRDKMSTGTRGNSGIGAHITLYDERRMALGLTSEHQRKAYDQFSFKTIKLNQTISAEEFSKI